MNVGPVRLTGKEMEGVCIEFWTCSIRFGILYMCYIIFLIVNINYY